MTPAERADILDKAADYIDEHGWTQDEYAPADSLAADEPPCCAYGAIGMVTVRQPNAVEYNQGASAIAGFFERFIAKQVLDDFGDGMTVDEFNDADGRTKEEVTAALRSCAAELRQS